MESVVSTTEENEFFETFDFEKDYVKMKECKIGQAWEGWYVEKREKPLYGNSYELRSPDKKPVVLPGKGQLDYFMKQVNLFDYLKITYLGKKKLETGAWAGTEAHNFSFARAPGKSGQDKMNFAFYGIPLTSATNTPDKLPEAPKPSVAAPSPEFKEVAVDNFEASLGDLF